MVATEPFVALAVGLWWEFGFCFSYLFCKNGNDRLMKRASDVIIILFAPGLLLLEVSLVLLVLKKRALER